MTPPPAPGEAAETPMPSPHPVAHQRPGMPTGWRARLLPRPLLALALWLTWLMLQHSLEPAHLLGGALLALVLSAWAGPPPRAVESISASALPSAARPDSAESSLAAARQPTRVDRLLIALRLIGVILKDIVLANLQVARLILGRQERLNPGFVTVPLRVHDPRAVSCLAAIITMTPGTVSAELSDDRTELLVHALDLHDPEALVTLIRERYEQPLLELMS